MATDWQKIKAYMNLSPEQRAAADRAQYRYLPADELMAAAGYEHKYLGLYAHTAGGLAGPMYEISFFSQSGTAVLQLWPAGGRGPWQAVAAQVVASDEQLQQFLQAHQFPPVHPNSVGI